MRPSARVVISAHGVVGFPDGGGHLWAYLQHAQGLRAAGCDVWWLERIVPTRDPAADQRRIANLAARLTRAGLAERLIVYAGGGDHERRYLTVSRGRAEDVFANADLLLNFYYAIDPELLARFSTSALVDIDPGLLQVWIQEGQLEVAPHEVYFTTGETVGTARATFPSCGLDWVHIRPAVSLEQWPFVRERGRQAFTTVSTWWGDEWMVAGDGSWYENNKRVTFLEYATLPRLVQCPMELALHTGPGDAADIALLDRYGWRVRHSGQVTSTPEAYREYVQSSRGEFSCAKPSCMRLQNAWISDRTLCYLASGRPAVVQHTGPSEFLDGRDGLIRFSSIDEAANGLARVNADYERHRVAARELAQTYFDARAVAEQVLDFALGRVRRQSDAQNACRHVPGHQPLSAAGRRLT